MRDGCEGGPVVGVDDEARDLIGLIGNDMFAKERGERQVGERKLRGDPFLAGLGRKPGQLVAAPQRRGFGQQVREIAERVTASSNRRAIHGESQGWPGS